MTRSLIYRRSQPANEWDGQLLRRLDELCTAHPSCGSGRTTLVLRDEGHVVDRKRARRLMRLREIEALAPRPSTSKPAPGNKVCLDLLRGLDVTPPNRVWTADLASMPVGRGWP